MNKKRFDAIDDIRGISIIVMILIHTNVYFLRNKISYATLEMSQFAVVAFIFCSAYLLYLKPAFVSVSTFISFVKKRIVRLVIPYYAFLLLYLLFLIPKETHRLTFTYFFQNISLTGGLDFNWLVLLFIELAILMPVFKYWHEKKSKLLSVFLFFSILSTLFFLKFSPLPFYRSIMWLPWSLIPIYTLYFPQLYQNKRWFWIVTVISFFIFVISQQYVLPSLHHSLRMYDNKYPPNIYHLSYGIFGVNLLYFLSQKGVFSLKPVQTFIHFFSVYSYTIFFIHILVIYILTVFFRFHFTWVSFFIAVITITGITQVCLNTAIQKLKIK